MSEANLSDAESSADEMSDAEYYLQDLVERLTQIRDYAKQLTNAITVGSQRTFPVLLGGDDRVIMSADIQIIIYQLYRETRLFKDNEGCRSKQREIQENWIKLHGELVQKIRKLERSIQVEEHEDDRVWVCVSQLVSDHVGYNVSSMH